MSGKVLIVDDDPTVRESLRALLEGRGLSTVGAARDGNEAVSMASSLESRGPRSWGRARSSAS